MVFRNRTFGQKLIFVALLSVLAYIAIMLIVGLWAGWTIASITVPGVVPVFCVLLNKLEAKHFKAYESQAKGINRSSFSGFWYFLVLSSCFVGLQLIFGIAIAALLVFVVEPNLGSVQLPSLDSDVSTNGFWFIVLAFLINCVTYFLGGFLCGKTATHIRYGYAASASLTAIAINVLPFLPVILQLQNGKGYAFLFGMIWLAYVLTALLGARIGSRQPILEAIIPANPALDQERGDKAWTDREIVVTSETAGK